jgi:hypothetical protein
VQGATTYDHGSLSVVGLCRLNQVDPYLITYSLSNPYPKTYQVKIRFQSLPFKFNLQCYTVVILSLASGATVDVRTTASTGKIRGTTGEHYTCFSGWLIANA